MYVVLFSIALLLLSRNKRIAHQIEEQIRHNTKHLQIQTGQLESDCDCENFIEYDTSVINMQKVTVGNWSNLPTRRVRSQVHGWPDLAKWPKFLRNTQINIDKHTPYISPYLLLLAYIIYSHALLLLAYMI